MRSIVDLWKYSGNAGMVTYNLLTLDGVRVGLACCIALLFALQNCCSTLQLQPASLHMQYQDIASRHTDVYLCQLDMVVRPSRQTASREGLTRETRRWMAAFWRSRDNKKRLA